MTVMRFDECRRCGVVGRLQGWTCARCSKRNRMAACVECGTPVWPDNKRCRACCRGAAALKRSEIIAALDQGLPKAQIARQLSLTLGAMYGFCWRQGWSGEQYTGPNTLERLDALEARMKVAKDDWDAKVAAGLVYRQAERGADEKMYPENFSIRVTT